MSETVVVAVYKRHNDSCKYREDRNFKRCDCHFWLQWSFNKKQTKLSAKAVAKELGFTGDLRDWATVQRLALAKTQALDRQAAGELTPQAMTLAEAVRLFLEAKDYQHQIGEISKGTLTNNKRVIGKLLAHFEGKLLKDIKASMLDAYQRTWNTTNKTTISVYQTLLSSFFLWCVKKEDITGLSRNPYMGVDRVQPSDEHQTPPFTEEEMTAILAAVPKAAELHGWNDWHTRRILALILLQRWSGLSAVDAVCLERKRLNVETGQVETQRIKTGEYVSVVLPQFVVQAILSCNGDGCEEYFFWSGNGDRSSAASGYSVSMKQVLEVSGVKFDHAHMVSHRFRDTFAVRLLESGVPMEHVSKLLGHSNIQTTEKAYNPWTKKRQELLNASVKLTWPGVGEQVGVKQPTMMIQ